MPNYTKHYNFIKPNKTENYDIEDVTNKNMDILDEELFGKEDKVPGKGPSTNDFTNEYKNKLDGLENYDDTELINKLNEQVQKNNLQEQEIEELQEQITNLQEENTQLEDQIPNGQSTGNPIYINDSSNLEASIRLNGGDKQVVTELGENILDSTEYNGIEITEDTNTGFGLSFLPLKLGEPLVPGNYSFAMFFTDGTVSGSNVSLNLYDSNNSLVTTSSSLFNFTEEQIAEIANYRIFTNTTGLELYMGKTIQGVMLVKGSTKPSVYKEFIHASPTPNNPSKVETVGSNINLFDKDNANILTKLYIDNTNMKIATTSENTNMIIFPCKKNKDYTISREAGTQFRIATTTDMPANNVAINNTLANHTGTEISITTGESDNYIAIYIGTNDLTDVLNSLKIEEGDKATPYSPYGMGNVEIDVINKNLAEIELGDINPTTGTENAATKVFRSNYIRVKNGATYVWSVNKTLTNPLNIRLYDIDKNYIGYASFTGQKTYTITNGDVAYLRVRCDLVGEETIDGLIVQIEEGNTATDIVEHEKQTKIMPIQQEMLEGDYIEDVEHHTWKKLILDGTENWQWHDDGFCFANVNDIANTPTNTPLVKSNYFLGIEVGSNGTNYSDKDNVIFSWYSGTLICIKATEKFTNVEDARSYLAEQYSTGTPVTAYYKLATPIDLELTEAQKEAKKINTYNNVTNIAVDNNLATLDVTYKKDQETVNKNYKDRIAALEAAILS